jgi:copper homeostasis protein
MKIIKEACVGKLEQAKMAEYYNADRVEICSRLDLDGLTPDRSTIEETIRSLSIPVKVMIRPKSDNFIYSDLEIIKMESDIEFCKGIGVNEVVFGMLNEENHIDIDLTQRLAKRAFPMNITFHKAIDHTGDIMLELKSLFKVKEITSILTSGGEDSAIDGQNMIKDIIHNFSPRFNIIVAGGISDQNFEMVHSSIDAKEYHGQNIVGQLKGINK